jgi:hypothetical protein
MRRTARAFAVTTTALLGLAAPALAGVVSVGSGASVDLGTGSLALGCADLTVTGTFSAGSVGFQAARDVTIDPTGVVNGGSATLQVAGEWDNAGTFNAGTSTVQLVDGCGLASAVIAGDTTFANLDLTTATGKLYSLMAGSTQTVTGSLNLVGAAGNLLAIQSTLASSEAFIDLQGSHFTDYVDVQDNHAIGSPITYGSSSQVGPNTVGWIYVAVPALGVGALLLLALAMLWAGRAAPTPGR